MSTSLPFIPVNIAVLTISDSRTEENDTSGKVLVERAEAAGHRIVDKRIVADDIYQIRAALSTWIADDEVNAISARSCVLDAGLFTEGPLCHSYNKRTGIRFTETL